MLFHRLHSSLVTFLALKMSPSVFVRTQSNDTRHLKPLSFDLQSNVLCIWPRPTGGQKRTGNFKGKKGKKREKKSWTCYVYPGQSKCMDLQAPLFLLIVFPHLTTFEAVVWTQLFDGFICHVSVGIKVGDIGAKFSPTMNGTDNGYLMFDHVRIPRNQMLMGLAKVKQLILFSSYHFFFLAEHENILISDKLIL